VRRSSCFYYTTAVKKETGSKRSRGCGKVPSLSNYLIHRLASLAPRLQPELLHRVISAYGLEDCAELVAQATPAQLSQVFDLDLWRPTRPGLDERFDAERFGVWIEVLVEAGADLAAEKLSQMPLEQLIAGFAQHVRVMDVAALAAYETSDGERVESRDVGDELARELGGYHVAARREDAWDAIVAVLLSLDGQYRGFFDELMSALRSLSDSDCELDGLDELLERRGQMMFDAASERGGRRETQGFASPSEARAFLQMSRSIRPGAVPPPNPLARAYFRSLDSSPTFEEGSARREDGDANVEAVELLTEAGVLPQQVPRGLLASGQDQSPGRLTQIHRYMSVVFERDPVAYGERNAELAYLTNVLMAGCSIQSRPFTAKEASDAVVAACNLGLAKSPSLPDDYLVGHELVGVFQIGWAALHEEVATYAAKRLIQVLGRLRCPDDETRKALRMLQFAMKKEVEAGTPWHAEPALDVIAIFDQPAWLALVALIAECPVITDALTASVERRTRAIDAHAFTFITGDSDIAVVRNFMTSLPGLLG
jgi:hypothetical protein